MEVRALTRFARISPTKARDVARVIRGKPAEEALDLLRFIPRKSARLLHKTLQTAIANAENNHNLPANALVVSKCFVDEGPAIKRFKPVARGSAHPFKRRTSHFTIVLSDEAGEAQA